MNDPRAKILESVLSQWDADSDDAIEASSEWALVQYNGGRAPNEKYISLHATSADACGYAANDEEWEPEAIVNLRTGEVHGVERQVHMQAVEDTLEVECSACDEQFPHADLNDSGMCEGCVSFAAENAADQ